MSDETFALLALLLGTLILTAIYVTPTFIAFRRCHPNRWLIAVINIVFGGTLLGWLIALVWALKAFHIDDAQTRGGESGLNLFINDPKKIEILPSSTVPPVPTGASFGIAAEIEQLHRLLHQGAVTQTEFDSMKARLLRKSDP
ncbi:superinfection immunity protein [Rhodoplanes azumiensis]|uniref:Superinfection immunity protein n=1 Tax=Rhodoplanes azumiensis TaxID=1897628 RepID=A0ABW5AHZ4_9BRAD